jgi:hypothetical protein
MIEISRSLTIQDIVIDSIDSILIDYFNYTANSK